MSFAQKNFTELPDFEATAGEMQDADAARADSTTEEKKINKVYKSVVDLDQSGTTTGS